MDSEPAIRAESLAPPVSAAETADEANAPLATAVGLAVCTPLTLVFIPVLYALFEHRRARPAS